MNYITSITDIEDLVGEKLADASEITPQEIRESFAAVIEFLRKISPLATGVFSVGNIVTNDMRVVDLPYDVGTSDYRVQGSLISKSSDFRTDFDCFEMIKDKTTSSFKLCLREISNDNQLLDFEWAIYPKNT